MKYLIYFLFREDGKVEDYVPFALKAFRPYFDVIHVVSNGPILEGRSMLDGLADVVQVRPNTEFDVGAYKDAIFYRPDEYWNDVDELTLANFTFFGPVGDASRIFDWAASQTCDFWGVTAHKEMRPNPIDGSAHLPHHIQSHWISVRKSILSSPAFLKYWRDLPEIKSYNDSVLFHESQFTPHFESLGFTYEVMLDGSVYPSAYPAFNDIQHTIADGLPILKRRLFYHSPPEYYDAYDVNIDEALSQIRRDNGFPEDLVWDSARWTPIATLYQNADLCRVFPTAEDIEMPGDAGLEGLFVVQGPLEQHELTRIARQAQVLSDVTLHGLDKSTLSTLAATLTAAGITTTVAAAKTAGDLWKAVAAPKPKRSAAPVLFGVIVAGQVDHFLAGFRQIALDRTVTAFGRSLFEKNAYFGVGLPQLQVFGLKSDLDRAHDYITKRASVSLVEKGIAKKAGDIYLLSFSRVYLLRPAMLTLAGQTVLSVLTEAGKADLKEDDPQSDIAMTLDDIIIAGIPVIASGKGVISVSVSNTQSARRQLVKSETRLRYAAEATLSENAFQFRHSLKYLSNFSTQKGREQVFSQVHTDSFHNGWKKGWEGGVKSVEEKAAQSVEEANARTKESFDHGWKGGWDAGFLAAETNAAQQMAERAKALAEQSLQDVWDKAWNAGYLAAEANAGSKEPAVTESQLRDSFDHGWRGGWAEGFAAAQREQAEQAEQAEQTAASQA